MAGKHGKGKKKMSAQLKAFLKREGRFPRKGELGRKTGGGRKGGTRKASSKPAASSSPSKGMGLGASYQAGRFGVQVGAPLANAGITHFTMSKKETLGEFGERLGDMTLNSAYGGGLAVVALDAIVDKKFGHAAALSRGSVTAWAPELLTGFVMWDKFRELRKTGARVASAARIAGGHGVAMQTGYFPDNPNWAPSGEISDNLIQYRMVKHGLQVARHVANRTRIGKAITRPLRPVTRALGVAI